MKRSDGCAHRGLLAPRRTVRCLASNDKFSPATAGLFPNAEIAKDHVQNILNVDAPEQLAQGPGRQAKLFRHYFLTTFFAGPLGVAQRNDGVLQMCALALARNQGRFGSEKTV